MVETKTPSISKFRQKRLRELSKSKEAVISGNYVYPRNDLYTREEFELLDTIYSDEPSIEENKEIKPEIANSQPFWPTNKEEFLSTTNNKTNMFTSIGWFLGGVALSSLIWLIYFQINVHEIRAKSDTQIVFQKSVNIMTDKTVDKEVTKQLKDKVNNVTAPKENFFSKLFSKKAPEAKPAIATEPAVPQIEQVRFHTISNGDSLWIIANKYYSNPSPANINKIMKANNMKKIGVLTVGKKIVIPE